MSTERMNNDQGTARMDAGTARMDGSNGGAAATAAAVVFSSGQTIVLGGKDCLIDSMISMGSGEAIVYKVIIDNKPYALKHYKPNMPLSDTAKKVITNIKNNPRDRIIRIYGLGRYGEQDFEIMEYAQGGTLDQYLKNNGAIHDITKIKNIVKMITEGLEQLHGFYKVIYQDLKPENIYFRDTAKTSLVLADFGISSVMEGYDEEVEVTASVTDLYAAPELARKGNKNEVMATPAIDYFALGITMFELWLGEKPFKGIKATKRDYMIAEEKVDFPIDMPDDYAAIIRGLIRPQRKDRWGNEQVKKWLRGEALAVESMASQKASAAYDPLKFSNTESATTPKELAALMEKYPDIGKTCLYDGIIKAWFQKAGDLMLYNEIQNITSRYASDKDAGLYSAILALDPERPFRSRGGKICRTTEDIADAIMAESAYYMEDLKKPAANLYLYLSATEGSQGKEAADAFCKYFKEYTPKRALTLVYLKLQSDGGITIGSKHYQSPDELKREKDSGQIALVKRAVTEKDSMLLVWLSDIYGDNFKSTDTFGSLSIPEQFFLLGLLPFLSFKEFSGNSRALQELIDSYPGRSDLFETYAAQGLPLTGQSNIEKKTPVDYIVCNYKELRKHGPDTIRNLIRLLSKLGADINECSSNGKCPLINAYDTQNNDLVKLLLELGADQNQYRIYKERIVEQDRIERERKAEQERIERERREEQKRHAEQERQKEEAERWRKTAKENRKKRTKNFIFLMFPFLPFLAGIALYCVSGKEVGFFHSDLRISIIITSIIFLGVPLVLIYFRKLFVFSIIIFILAVLCTSGILASEDLTFSPWWGGLAMAAAFIMALKFPNENYWEHITKQERQKQKARRRQSSKKRFILIPVIVVTALAAFIVYYRLTGSFFKFQQNDQGALTITGYNGRKEVVIPATHKGISVTEIGDKAFYQKKITNVTIPDSVTGIGNSAFEDCTDLTSVNIPANVTSIGDKAFYNCYNLTDVTMPDSVNSEVTFLIVDGIWYNKAKTEFIFRPNLIKGITGKVTIPEGITSIGSGAFAGLTDITGVTIPDSVTGIGGDAFSGCTKLANVTIGNGVTRIGVNAFRNCTALTGITIPGSVTVINQLAFCDCSGLTSITIPKSVNSIGRLAFSGCTSLTSVTFQGTVDNLDNTAFGPTQFGTGFKNYIGDLYEKYRAGGAGTYTRPNGENKTWTKKR